MRKPRLLQSLSSEKPAQQQVRQRAFINQGRIDRQAVRRKRTTGSISLRAGVAVIGGRIVGAISRRLHFGGGTSIVGVVAQRLDPDIVEHLASQLEYGCVTVTGTNGKTTSSSFIGAILNAAGLRVWRNSEGSNLMRGVATSLVIRALPTGRLRRSGRAISVFEIDEAVVPQFLRIISPRAAVFTNLFRDQLDRYGEVDTVAARWREAIKLLPESTTLVLNADDPAIAYLSEGFTGKVLYYGVDDPSLDLSTQNVVGERHQVVDMRTCPRCGSDYEYDLRFYSHMGHYACPQCGLKRPQPDVRVLHAQTDSFDRLSIRVGIADQERDVIIPLPGLYNIYNALAAITVAQALNVAWEPVLNGIEQFKPVFGRGESIEAQGRTIRLLLAKNPTGFNEVLRTLFSEGIPRHVLFVLNDNTADGRDISWIWDVDFERVAGQTKTLVVAGTRTLDLALRLKYAGIAQEEMIIVLPAPLRATSREVAQRTQSRQSKQGGRPGLNRVAQQERQTAQATQEEEKPEQAQRRYGLKQAIDVALSQTPEGETLFIVPTYTGLLEIHRELEQRGLAPHYWEGKDKG